MHGHSEAMGAPPLEHCPLMPTYGPPTLQLVRGEGSWLWDRDGRRYLDLLSGLAVTGLGHSHPAVAAALHEQAQTLVHVSNLFGTEIGWQVACTLDRLLGTGQPGWPAEGTRGQVFFANSGAEANECALKLARRFGGRGRHVVVSAFGSFHGRTLATLHATGQPAKHEAFQPLPEGFRHVAWHDVDALEAALDPSVAAVLLEPVQGEGGVNPATPEYFQAVRRLCDERGILLMVDEVQTGLGRCGAWFGHQRLGVVPDVVTMAKALGNGVPIGACWAKTEVAAAFEPGDHATTYGGQPLATAAARAVLEVMEAEDVPARAERAGRPDHRRCRGASGRSRGTRPRPAPRRRARGARRQGCGLPSPRARCHRQRGHPHRTAPGAVTAHLRRRDRRGAEPPGGGTGGDPVTKAQRQHRIGKLLAENAVSSQTHLVDLLTAEGIQATQATVSRDLEDLGAIKVRGAGGDGVYAIPELPTEQRAPEDHLRRVFGDWVVEVGHSANVVVLRTPPGSAHVVGSALDRSGLPEVLGTVAGDDTLIVVVTEDVGGATVAQRLRDLAGLS